MSKGRVRTHVPNHRNRSSAHLKEAQIIAAIAAAVHARTLNQPLNRFVTIHLEKGELPGRAQDAVGAYLKTAGKWLRVRGVTPTYLWWLEHAVGTGLHVHMLIHVPAELRDAFSIKARHAWLRAAGLVPHAGVIRTERVEPRGIGAAGPTRRQQQSYQNQLQGVLRYMGKSIDPDATSSLHRHLPLAERPTAAVALGIRPEYCHPIYGRRISVSENIGPTARKRFEAERQRDALLGQAARSAAIIGVPIRRALPLAIQ